MCRDRRGHRIRAMKNVLVLLAVGAAAAAGYLVGDSGELGVASGIVGGVGLFALLIAWVVPADASNKTVSLRPGGQGKPAARVLHPGDMAKERERQRLVSEGAPVGLRLVQTGGNQIAVIKVLRNYLDIGLKEAKDLSDAAKQGQAPVVTAEMDVARAIEFCRDVEAAGGVLELEEVVTR